MGWRGPVQIRFHLVEGAFSLLEKVEDNALAELALVLIVVHLENLLKGGRVDGVAGVRQAGGALLALRFHSG